jgi:hypothetical protein
VIAHFLNCTLQPSALIFKHGKKIIKNATKIARRRWVRDHFENHQLDWPWLPFPCPHP